MRLGIISDTHDLLRPEVFAVFAEVDHILHAGDIGSPDILTALEALAPVTAVYGNTDGWEIRERVPAVQSLRLDGFDTLSFGGSFVEQLNCTNRIRLLQQARNLRQRPRAVQRSKIALACDAYPTLYVSLIYGATDCHQVREGACPPF